MFEQARLSARAEQAVDETPGRHGQLAIAEQHVPAALFERLAIPDKCKNQQVGRLKRRQPAEKSLDVALGVVVADTAIEHLDLFPSGFELGLQQAGYGPVFRNTPSERNRTA